MNDLLNFLQTLSVEEVQEAIETGDTILDMLDRRMPLWRIIYRFSNNGIDKKQLTPENLLNELNKFRPDLVKLVRTDKNNFIWYLNQVELIKKTL